MENDQILTKSQVADFLQVSKRSIDYWVVTGLIPYSRIGKRGVRFKKSRLLKWLDEVEGRPFHREAKTG
jgi:excisionase family DNA binding protein